MVQIKNEILTVEINPFGAELYSIKYNNGYEYLWQGNPDVWSGRAPVLFPIVGDLRAIMLSLKKKRRFPVILLPVIS